MDRRGSERPALGANVRLRLGPRQKSGLRFRKKRRYLFTAMSTRELIEREVAELSEPLQREVYDFARFLRAKRADDVFDGLLLSETALARDWNTPEEDAAWASL